MAYGNVPQFVSSGNAGTDISNLRSLAQNSQGFLGGNNYLAGSAGASFSTQADQLQELRGVDPFSYYRGSFADRLANEGMQSSPSNFYQQKLQAMSSGEFSPDDPSYQFRFNQGLQANERSLAARGLLNSGNAGIELQEYGQQAASQEYGAQFQRMLQAMQGTEGVYDQQQQRLMELAGVRNVGAGIQQRNLDQNISDNLNEQLGLAAASRGNQGVPKAVGFGSGALG